MLLDNVIASAIAVGCAVSVGVLSIVIAYILHWMARLFPWMVQTVFLFFFPHKPLELFGETWYTMWEKWKNVTLKLSQDTDQSSASGNRDEILQSLTHAQIQIHSMWYTLEHGITLFHRDVETMRIANDVQAWSKALLLAQLNHISAQIAYIMNSDSSESTVQHIQYRVNKYREDANIYRAEVQNSERAMHAHRAALRLQGQNNRIGSLAVLVSLIAIATSIGSC